MLAPTLLVLSFLIPTVFTQRTRPVLNVRWPDNPCGDAPTESARIICEQLRRWDEGARSRPPVPEFAAFMPGRAGKPRMIAAELAPIESSPYQCMDLRCLCTYLRGKAQPNQVCILPNGQPLKKAIRKEYRMLSDDERQRFHSAIVQLKRSGEFDKMAIIHAQFSISGGAHSGPAFLPWHREFMKRMEIALRQIDPALSLPYWDSTLDSRLPEPKDSVMWTDTLMGATDANGSVVTGDFADFVTFQNHPHIRRKVGAQGLPFKESDIDYVMAQNRIEKVLAYTAPRQGCQFKAEYDALEYTHGNVHIFVGGDMFDPYTSGNDPAFYLLHSFVDYIWEMYRQRKQSRYDRESMYAADNQLCSSALHFGSALMRPFEPRRNVDGLSNKYTDNLYEYAPRPSCNSGPTCGSKFLFCDYSHGAPRCASMARIGGNCSGFVNGEPVCYNGRCVNGRCVAVTVQLPATRPPPVLPSTQAPIMSVQANCYNENECCSTWASAGECERNAPFMSEWCKVSCKKCRPNFNPALECADFHRHCRIWARNRECERNRLWMSENCRRSCSLCSATRAQVCGAEPRTAATAITTTIPPPIMEHCDSPGCYNENVCCPLWGLQGQCSLNATWMACNCKVSCGLCIPTHYNYGTCNDYHTSCRAWAAAGECTRNSWMLENCRTSCRSCLDQWELRERCRISTIRRWDPQRFDRGNQQQYDYDYD
ncbi:Putative tyrosinase-like protein tyr-3 [Toxocara canis]|uniref:Putative tyrosinase-like protein tyr-3 n=1 Tax=Toxocara canis TaxID=6265 RepID=A0A0B2V753_TOXCA|nr:Putative tyrosinase-like protein tyr-3 [Toxocara canis]